MSAVFLCPSHSQTQLFSSGWTPSTALQCSHGTEPNQFLLKLTLIYPVASAYTFAQCKHASLREANRVVDICER